MTDRIDQDPLGRYAEYFDIVRADSPALLDEAYRLRYQVYCVEHPFENPAEHVDGREQDPDDDRSVHTLLVHRQTGFFAGTVRVIMPWSIERRPLPIYRILASQHPRLVSRLPARSTAEISRFAVTKAFRRRQREDRYADANIPARAAPTADERRALPYITFGLIRGVVEICLEYGISHITAVMEPALIRILDRFGVHFEQIGAPVDYHGLRQACVASLADLVDHNRADRTPLWQYTAQYALPLYREHDGLGSASRQTVVR